jgi:osmotically-inducible protein OsmY
MTTATLHDADVRVRDAVMRQLDWDPEVDASAVGVTAKNGTVTLTGFIDTYAGKLAAERAAKRVHGVRAVANDIDVRLRLERTDADVAEDAARALELRSAIPESVQVVVHNGHVTHRQSRLAVSEGDRRKDCSTRSRRAQRVEPHHRGAQLLFATSTIASSGVASECGRGCSSDHGHSVRRYGNIDGTVGTWLQRESAERATASAPGIAHIDNRIIVQSFHDSKMEEWGMF